MYYERPSKKTRRPREPQEISAPQKGGVFSSLRERRERREALEREAQAREAERLRKERARERRRAVWRFFFATPNRRTDDEAEEYMDEPSAAPPRRSRHPFLRFVALLLALLLVCAGVLYIAPANLFGAHDKTQFLANASLPSGVTHILILGIDRDANGTSRSDTMMVLSVGRGTLCLTSLMRDTGVAIPGRSGTHRLNAAYAYGGPELAIQTVNQNFGLDITRYALVDYESFPVLIDALGGVTLSVSDAEAAQINHNVGEILYRSFKTGQASYDDAYSRYLNECLPAGGENLRLSGTQALGYARIRNLDSDYGRTSRQRKVLMALAKQLKSYIYRPFSLLHFLTNAISVLETNMTIPEMLSLGEKALFSGDMREMRLPANGTYTDSGGMFYNVNYAANHDAFMEFVYGQK